MMLNFQTTKNITKLPLAFFSIFVFVLPACAPKQKIFYFSEYEHDAIRLEHDTVFSNAFLGISYTVPKSWLIYDLNSANFNEFNAFEGASHVSSLAETEGIEKLDIIYGNGFNRIDLLNIANLRKVKDKNYINLKIFAEFYRTEKFIMFF